MSIVLAAVLGGCGDEEKKDSGPPANGITEMKPAEVLEAADEAMAALQDVTYEGTLWGDGMSFRTVDVFVIGEAYQHSQTSSRWGGFRRLCIGDDTWGRKDLKWLRRVIKMSPAMAERWAAGWLAAPSGAIDCSDQELVPEAAARRTFRTQEVVSVAGQEALRLDGEDDHGKPLSLWIATHGEPLVLRAAGSTLLGARWKRTLSASNSGVELSRPSRRDVLDFSPR